MTCVGCKHLVEYLPDYFLCSVNYDESPDFCFSCFDWNENVKVIVDPHNDRECTAKKMLEID